MRRIVLTAVAALWVAWLIVAAMFYPVGGDEAGYAYSMLAIARGKLPVLDMFILQPPDFYIPFAAVARWLSPSLEAMRLVSVASIVAVTAMVAALAHQRYGSRAGLLAFVLIGLSHVWFYWNVQVIHYPVANFCLVGAFYLVERRRPDRRDLFLAGFAAGWLGATRLVLGPAAVALLAVAVIRAQPAGRRQAIGAAMVFCLGGLIAALPLLAVLAADPQATVFDLLRARARLEYEGHMGSPTGVKMVVDFLSSHLGVLWGFFFWFDTTLKAQYINIAFLVLGAAAAVGFARAPTSAPRRAFLADPVVRHSAVLAAVVVLAHFATIILPYYIQAVLPLMALTVCAALYHAGLLPAAPEARVPAWMRAVLAVSLVPYVAVFLGWTTVHALRRNEPSSARPQVAAQVGCWVEENTAAGDTIMSFAALPAVYADRRLPDGMEYNNATAQLAWMPGLDEATAARYRLVSADTLAARLRAGTIAVLVDDKNLDQEPWAQSITAAIAANYRTVATTGGAFPYVIKVRNDLWRETLPRFDAPAPSRVGVHDVGLANLGWLARLGGETAAMAATLPGDLADALARLRHAPFEDRCRRYLRLKTAGEPLK
ncbi:MAG: ArnT family glycosyltransferase [Actinomycetota bacterium]